MAVFVIFWAVSVTLLLRLVPFLVELCDWIIDPGLELVGPYHVVNPVANTESDENKWEQNARLLFNLLWQMLVVERGIELIIRFVEVVV